MPGSLSAMCGRFVQALEIDDYARFFRVDRVDATVTPSFNVAPTAEILGVVEREETRTLRTFSWGMTSPRAGRVINARIETVATKPMFAEAFSTRRCLVPADGYYEWRTDGRQKLPQHIRLQDGQTIGFAGIWSSRRLPSGELESTCALVTAAASTTLQAIHDRMPVMLDPSVWDAWLDVDLSDAESILASMRTVPDGWIETYPVSTMVNSVRNDGPECVVPLPTLFG